MKVRSIIRIALPFLILLSCVEEEEFERKYPHVTTSAVTEITGHGAEFSAHIDFKNLDLITETGFIWGQHEDLDEASSFRTTLGPPVSTEISANVKAALVASKLYYVRAFAKANDKTSYGNIVQFMSLGSDGPVISSIQPLKGVLGDTITIFGKNFIGDIKANRVKFGNDDITGSVLEAYDSAIVVTIPQWIDIEPNKIAVSVSIEGNVSYGPEPFEILLDEVLPKIESITPMAIANCDTVMIVGKNLYKKNYPLSITVNHNIPQEAVILYSSPDTLLAVINSLPPGEMVLTLTTGRFEITSGGFDFQELRPEFVSISPTSHAPGDVMTLKYKNFPACWSGGIYANGSWLTPISRTKDEMKFKMPEDYCIGDGAIGISKEPGDYNWLFVTPMLSQKPPKITSFTPSHGGMGDEVVITGTNFWSVETWQFSFIDITSTTDKEIKGTIRQPYDYFGAPLDLVVYACGKTDTLKAAFTYDPPAILDFNPKVITTGNEVITITGKNFFSNWNTWVRYANVLDIGNEHFLTYTNTEISFSANLIVTNPLVDLNISKPIQVQTMTGVVESSEDLVVDHVGPWKQLSDFPGGARSNAGGFSIGGKGYICLGVNQSGNFVKDIWEYTESTDTWTKKANYPGSTAYDKTATAAGGKGYVGLGISAGKDDWYEYDPASDVWTKKADYPGTLANYKFAIEINNKIYAGGGYKPGNVISNEFWEYDPATNVWTRKADLPGIINFLTAQFGFQGKGYAYASLSSNWFEFIYDPVTNLWTSTPKIPLMETTGAYVITPFSGYVVTIPGSRFNQLNNMQKVVPEGSALPAAFGAPRRLNHSGFSIGNFGYTGLGQDGGYRSDFWRFDPSRL